MKRNLKQIVSVGLAATMVMSLTACGGGAKETAAPEVSAELPTIDSIKVGEDYQDIKAEIKVLTDRTDVVDTVYKGYAEQFMELYPNITVTYEGVTDYEQSLTLRLPTGEWGDICYIPTSVDKDEFSEYFIPLGDYETLDGIYNFCTEKNYDGKQYGIANGGTAGGVVYNKRIWKEAGITEMPKTPDDFLDCLQKIKDNTEAVPLYTNFAAGWTMGAWDQYIGIPATGDLDFMNNHIVHSKDPFAKRDDMTGPYAVYYVLYEAVARKLVEEDPASSDWESSKGAMNKGDIATMVLGSWAVNQCKDSGSTPEDVAYMPFPISVDGKQYANSQGNYSFAINNKATQDNQIAALVYLKWLLEDSPIYEDEGSIPALKSEPLPDVLADFGDTELVTDNPALEGEEMLFQEVNNESEVGINNNDYPDCEILESALYGTKTLDELMAEWNAKWSAAQESLGVEITQ
ncbi:MAG: ABC transporter substrate-binding protein [Eubacteriales bacterium]|nr:ABC transporter substrate-binding protein [Eubacteriales bacterium]